MGNKNLTSAKKAKNDEFYTQLTDIEKEMKHYREHFKGKTVFLNCDDPETSMFWKFFELNFDFLGLKKLIATHYDRENPTYKLEISCDVDLDGDGEHNHTDIVKTPLQQNGDFRSPECVELLKQSDIVVTNPPFSLFREYVAQLIEYDKKFVIIGNMNACTYKEIFPLIVSGRLWIGANEKGGTRKGNSMLFAVPDGYQAKNLIEYDGKKMAQVSAWWFTNLDFAKRHEELVLFKKYDPDDYPKYDEYDAIECARSANIPCDYEESWGVPLDIVLNLEKWHVLYSGYDSNKQKLQWVIPTPRTLSFEAFSLRQDGYVSEITDLLAADVGLNNNQIQYRSGAIGVPISFLNGFYNPEQFELLGDANHGCDHEWDLFKPLINGKDVFKRMIIRRKPV